MLPLETIVTFFAAALLLAAAPGPDNLFVLTQSALYGTVAGLVVVLGLCTGLVCHTLAVAFGVATIFKTSAAAFTVLKFLGAAYLLYLAWRAFTVNAIEPDAQSRSEPSRRRLYLRGVIMNITNPKVTIFFLALLPQFTDPTRGDVTLQLLTLGALFILATIIVFGGVAIGAGTLQTWFSDSPRIQLRLNRLAGVVFVSLALKLATASRA
jgi:threonine/homoserine/homoserine lactone efflux protein